MAREPSYCFKCGEETVYSVMAGRATYDLGDTEIKVCLKHMLKGALESHKKAMEIEGPLRVRVYRELAKDELMAVSDEYIGTERIPENIILMEIAPELWEKVDDVIQKYRKKHGY